MVCKFDDFDALKGVSPSNNIDERWLVCWFSWKKRGEEEGGNKGGPVYALQMKSVMCVCACVHVRFTFMWTETIKFHILDGNADALFYIYPFFKGGHKSVFFFFFYYTMYGYDLSNGKIMIPMALNLFILNDAQSDSGVILGIYPSKQTILVATTFRSKECL